MKELQHNLELKELARLDQLDRTSYVLEELSEEELWKRDRLRLLKIIEIVENKGGLTAKDCVNAAIVFQHGRNEKGERDSFASSMAIKMMNKAITLDSSTHKWLLAAAIDRDLMIRNQPQIYGTQYTRVNKDSPWVFHSLDTTKISDEERKAYAVETIAEQKLTLQRMNKKKLVELYAEFKDVDRVIEFCIENSNANSAYDFSWRGMSSFAFLLSRLDKKQEALKAFHLLIQFHPEEYDPYHSLGILQIELGMLIEAEQSFIKSLELNPNFKTGERDLKDLREQIKNTPKS